MTLLPDADGVFRERRTRQVGASPQVVWSCVADLGGAPGWYAANRLWAARHLLDRLLGGPGRRGRPDRPLRVGDPVDGWRVSALEEGRALTLVSQHRMPGRAVLTHVVRGHVVRGHEGAVAVEDAVADSCVLEQRLDWHPDGLPGRLLWWLELPGHVLVMDAMVRNLARAAERGQADLVGSRR